MRPSRPRSSSTKRAASESSSAFMDSLFADEPSPTLLKRYALEEEYPVGVNESALQHVTYEAIPGKFLSREHQVRNKNDKFIKRSLIRHDGEAVAQALLKLL